MRLSGPPGSTVRSAFRVENTTTTPMSVELVASPLRREGTGEEAGPAVVFDPPRAELTPGQEAQVAVILPVGKDMAPGAVYHGTINAAGVERRPDRRAARRGGPAAAASGGEDARREDARREEARREDARGEEDACRRKTPARKTPAKRSAAQAT